MRKSQHLTATKGKETTDREIHPFTYLSTNIHKLQGKTWIPLANELPTSSAGWLPG